MKGHDAGIEGTFTDGSTTASLKVDLSVGKTISIAGQSFNIVSDTSANAATAKDSLSKIQSDIIKISNTGAKVTVNGTEFVSKTNNDGKMIFDAGTGVTYTSLELSGMVKDGTSVSIKNAKDSNSADIDDTSNQVARDYSSANNITATDAETKIAHALSQANRVGNTNNDMSVTSAKSVTVGAVTIDDAGSATADVALIAYDATNGTMKEIQAGGDVTEYLKTGSTYKLDKQAGTNGTSFTTNGANAINNTLLVHNDGAVKGARYVAAGDALTGDGITGTPAGTANVAANYTAYEEVTDTAAVATITGASHSAYATLTDNNVTLTFENVKNANIAEGQNAFLAHIGEVNITYTQANTAGTFSHQFNNIDGLDVAADGTVTYKGDKIAQLTSGANNGAAGNTALATNVSKNAAFVGKQDNSEYTFTINKGTTTVDKDLALNIHVGADADMTNKIGLQISAMTSEGLGIDKLNVADGSGMAATYAVDSIENAIKTVSEQRSVLGAVQNRLEHTIKNLDNVVENTTAAESQIRDTDMATEMVKYSNSNILAQAGQSMLAQSNQSNQGVLSLLG